MLHWQYKKRYQKLYGNMVTPNLTKAKASCVHSCSGVSRLMCELSSDDDSDASLSLSVSSSMNPSAVKPWLHDFNVYLNSQDQLTGDQTIVQWWGVNGARYPVWASLTRDFLSIMASSVLSECAFSSAGITISKHHNQLKADIVEALQCLKCLIKCNILFQDSDNPSVIVALVACASTQRV